MKYNHNLLLLFFNLATFLYSQSIQIPTITNPDAIIVKDFYILQYNEFYEQADWVAYELTREEVLGSIKRKDSFKSDPSISTGSATLEDYKGSGYDRGHLAPAADMKMSSSSMSDSFYMSNMSPQHPSLNRGIWSKLESYVRTWVYENGSVYIVTGPILTKDTYPTIWDNEIAVPEYYYKVILDYTHPELKDIGFILPNGKVPGNLSSYAYTIDYVEEFTGLDFFPSLPDQDEEKLESSYDISLWTFKTFTAPKVEEVKVQKDTYWINTSSMTRHNSSCKYNENTKNGYLTTDADEGKACSQCGGWN